MMGQRPDIAPASIARCTGRPVTVFSLLALFYPQDQRPDKVGQHDVAVPREVDAVFR